jgi:hypothetical protein
MARIGDHWGVFRATTFLGLTLLGAALFIGRAHAVPEYLGVLLTQYRLNGDAVAQGARCQYCHVYEDGSVPWNAFGDRVHDALFDTGNDLNIGNALYTALKDNADSDGDGYTDVLEVVAKTLPGDANSKPTKSVAELEAELKALGGVDAFKPR